MGDSRRRISHEIYYYEEYERNHKEGRYFSQTNTETALLSKIFIQTNEDAWTKASVFREQTCNILLKQSSPFIFCINQLILTERRQK